MTIRGELEADKGNVELPGKLRIASVAQETPSLSDLALDFVLSGDDVVARGPACRGRGECTRRLGGGSRCRISA